MNQALDLPGGHLEGRGDEIDHQRPPLQQGLVLGNCRTRLGIFEVGREVIGPIGKSAELEAEQVRLRLQHATHLEGR